MASAGGGGEAAHAAMAYAAAPRWGLGKRRERDSRVPLRHGVFAVVEAKLGDPGFGDGCAAAVLVLVRFNKDVFVGPVLMGRAVGALVGPLVDELHARGELPRLVSLLCSADPRIRTLALEFALRVGYYGRKEIVDALLAEGLVKRLLALEGVVAAVATAAPPRPDPVDRNDEEEKQRLLQLGAMQSADLLSIVSAPAIHSPQYRLTHATLSVTTQEATNT
uniref:Uncharacterized protein n=1 Tax=Oryza sativa subsp. japonica TaxID=39947 RepID=Q84S69_ORYSJ|nr:hypothetical protein [Oryza sativa Japonica Group]